jgi:hypothetical protein
LTHSHDFLVVLQPQQLRRYCGIHPIYEWYGLCLPD